MEISANPCKGHIRTNGKSLGGNLKEFALVFFSSIQCIEFTSNSKSKEIESQLVIAWDWVGKGYSL